MKPIVTIIVPTRNEEKNIEVCLKSIIAQDYPHEYIDLMVMDGVSEDQTAVIAKKYSLKYRNIQIIQNPFETVPHALNKGVTAGKGAIIIRMDAHAAYSEDYLSKCVEAVERTHADNVGGPMLATGEGMWGKAIAAAHHSVFGLGGGKFHDLMSAGVADTVYLGAFPRATFEKYGLFDERLDRNQDIEFNARIRKMGGKVWLDPSIRSTYFCKDSLRGLWKQNFANGKWVIYTKTIAPYALSWRHFIPLIFVGTLLTTGIVASLLWSTSSILGTWAVFLFALAADSYLLLNLLFSGLIAYRKGWRYLFLMPVVFAVLHLSYGFGSFWGVLTLPFWYMKNRNKEIPRLVSDG